MRRRARRCEFPVPRRLARVRRATDTATPTPTTETGAPGTTGWPAMRSWWALRYWSGWWPRTPAPASGASSTNLRVAPPAMLDLSIGPLIGDGGESAAPVHLSAADQHQGWLLAVGRPGTGKSVLVRLAYAWNCLERVHPSGRPGHPGERNALIAFESKGAEGADIYLRWARATGDRRC